MIDDLMQAMQFKRMFHVGALTMLLATALLQPAAQAASTVDAAGPAPSSPAESAASAGPTFNRDIAPIVFANCASCHHPGEVAPFSLLTYADAKKHSTEIAELTLNRQMPPWKPAPGYGDFVGQRRISDEQIQMIQAWVKAGRPEGSPADLPPQPHFTDGWVLGQPDLVLKMPQAYELKASGRDVQRSFVVPLNLPEDRFVEAVEFRPSNRKIVHHALLYLDANGKARELDGADGHVGFETRGPGGFIPTGGLGGWAPGVTPSRLPDGIARYMKKGSDLVVQIHFHPSGKPETEQSTVGIYFAKRPPEKIFMAQIRGARPRDLNIPAGQSNFELKQSFTVPSDVKLLGLFPHAHLVCKEIEVNATLPDGKNLPLIWIKDWDWDWQDQYLYKQPLNIPKGTEVHMRFRFDNSENNPRNPSTPPQRVHWGEQTSDEMALCFFDIVVDKSEAGKLQSAGRLRRMLEAIRRNQAGQATTREGETKPAAQ